MQTYVKQQYIVLNDLRDGEKGSIFVALIFNYIIQTFRLISFGNYFCIFQRLVCENRSFLSDSHNFGLVSGKVIYDIVLDALMIDLLTLGNGGKFCVKYVNFSHLVLQVRDMVCIFVVQGFPNALAMT